MNNNEYREYLDSLNDEDLLKAVDEQLSRLHAIENDFGSYVAQIKKLNELQAEVDALLFEAKHLS